MDAYVLVSPLDDDCDDPAGSIARLLVDHGVPVQDAPWIAEALLAVGPISSGDRPSRAAVERSIDHQLGRPFTDLPSRDGALLEILRWAAQDWHVITPAGDGEPTRPDPDLRLRLLLPHWLDPKRAIDFDLGVEHLGAKATADANQALAEGLTWLVREGRLVRRRRVTPLRHLDLGLLRVGPFVIEFDPTNIRTLDYWLGVSTARTLVALRSSFEAEPADTLAAVAHGVHRRLDDWLQRDPDPRHQARRRARCFRLLAPSTRVLERRLTDRREDLLLAAAYWLYSAALHEAQSLDDAARRRVLESARAALVQLRSRLRATLAGDPAGRQAFMESLPLYGYGAQVMAMLEERIWPAMKLLLLALREVPEPSVPGDLRYWLESGHVPPPQPWSTIPSTLSSLVHLHVRREQRRQPDLRELRDDLAEFCLHRLETKEGATERGPRPVMDADMVEPSPVWRHCYVLAVRELKANPRRQGHRRLDWLAKSDPSLLVRREAAAAAKELRHGVALPKGSSPRRAIFAALWQLRQAQFLAPRGQLRDGAQLDAPGARRTRQKEVQRTQETELGEQRLS